MNQSNKINDNLIATVNNEESNNTLINHDVNVDPITQNDHEVQLNYGENLEDRILSICLRYADWRERIISNLNSDFFIRNEAKQLSSILVQLKKNNVALKNNYNLIYQHAKETYNTKNLDKYVQHILNLEPIAEYEIEGYVKEFNVYKQFMQIKNVANKYVSTTYQTKSQLEPALKLVDEVNKVLSASDIGDSIDFAKAMDILEQEEDQTNKNKKLFTNIKSFDKYTGGGFKSGQLVVIGARPSVGKTALILNFIKNILEQKQQEKSTKNLDLSNASIKEIETNFNKHEVLVFYSLETSKREVLDRFVKMKLDPKVKYLSDGYEEALVNTKKEIRKLVKNALIFNEKTSTTHLDIREDLQKIQKKYEIAGVFVDYIQLVAQNLTSKVTQREQLDETSRAFKNLAIEFNCPFIVLTQLSRDLEKRDEKTPRQSDVKGSGAIEQDANILFALSKKITFDKNTNQIIKNDNKIIVDVLKNRDAATGSFELNFDGSRFTFYE